MIDRFDVPEEINDMLVEAVRLDMIDLKDVYALATEYGSEWSGLVNGLLQIGYSNRLISGDETNAAMCKLADKYWKVKYG